MTERIQLRRGKGSRKPENAVVVRRPTKWGNPFVVGQQAQDRARCRAIPGLGCSTHLIWSWQYSVSYAARPWRAPAQSTANHVTQMCCSR